MTVSALSETAVSRNNTGAILIPEPVGYEGSQSQLWNQAKCHPTRMENLTPKKKKNQINLKDLVASLTTVPTNETVLIICCQQLVSVEHCVAIAATINTGL